MRAQPPAVCLRSTPARPHQGTSLSTLTEPRLVSSRLDNQRADCGHQSEAVEGLHPTQEGNISARGALPPEMGLQTPCQDTQDLLHLHCREWSDERVVRTTAPHLQDPTEQKAPRTLKEPAHPWLGLPALLPSRRCYCCLKAHTEKIRILNGHLHMWNVHLLIFKQRGRIHGRRQGTPLKVAGELGALRALRCQRHQRLFLDLPIERDGNTADGGLRA